MGSYFFCGIGGSGMLPLALILQGQGHRVAGSDRSLDQGRTPDKFLWIKSQGIALFAQDGSGITQDISYLVVSTAVEDSILDVKAAKEQGLAIIKRAELLAELFNRAQTRIAVAGTSGKSTTTGMIGYVLEAAGKSPTVMNGAVFRNFQSLENPYATALSGTPYLFVTEADESDGSISLYNPTIAVLNNIALDHKTMDELIALFDGFVGKSSACVLNLDNAYVSTLAASHQGKAVTYGIDSATASLQATNVVFQAQGVSALITDRKTKASCPLKLQVPGKHNLSNALACICSCLLLGLELKEICTHLEKFTGIKRRLEVVGTRNDITVIDDFAHNPDKIAATLSTLKQAAGRLRIVFQLHGFNPIRQMRAEFVSVFADHLSPDDQIFIPEVLYLGGTVDRSVTAQDLVNDLKEQGLDARWFAVRSDILTEITKETQAGDRIVVMGARDDTLSEFARDILNAL